MKKNVWIEPVVEMSDRRSKAEISRDERKSRLEAELCHIKDDLERLGTRKVLVERELAECSKPDKPDKPDAGRVAKKQRADRDGSRQP